MTHDVTWAVLLDGLLGNVIGTLGAFGAAASAILYDRRQRRRLDVRRAEAEKEERRRRAVVPITALVRTLEIEARLMPFLAGRTILTLSTALMTFEAEVGGADNGVASVVVNCSLTAAGPSSLGMRARSDRRGRRPSWTASHGLRW
jgi:hypothetical protein